MRGTCRLQPHGPRFQGEREGLISVVTLEEGAAGPLSP